MNKPVAVAEQRSFQPLHEYRHPSMPAADALQSAMAKLKQLRHRGGQQPAIAAERLRRTASVELDTMVSPPACGPLMNELHAALAEWEAQARPESWLKLIILPPCDEHGIVKTWANDRGHALLQAPARLELLNRHCLLPELGEAADGVLVIPHLEQWFLRHQHGLADVRALLLQLQTLQRHCVIGCNSWAWAFLCKAINAHMLLPAGETFQAFDAERLHGWFARLRGSEPRVFRSSQSGEPLFANEEGVEYFRPLAARSLGIPWVAWHLWRRSLRDALADNDAATPEAVNGEEQTVWVAALEEFSLPQEQSQTCLFVLQALLIHGSLSASELTLVLPLSGPDAAVAALVKAGFVERQQQCLRPVAAAYPAIRSALKTAGFPTGSL